MSTTTRRALLASAIALPLLAACGGASEPEKTSAATPKKTTKRTPRTNPPKPKKTKKPKEDPAKWAKGISDEVIENNAGKGKKWRDVCGGGDAWCSYVSDVTATTVGQLKVTLQVKPGNPQNKELARNAASFIILSAAKDHPELSWVIVQDGTGVVIDQFQPSNFGR